MLAVIVVDCAEHWILESMMAKGDGTGVLVRTFMEMPIIGTQTLWLNKP